MEFQGFQSALPFWILIPLAIAVIFLTYKSYNNQTVIQGYMKALLISIRSIAFIILLVLLLNPFFKGFEQINDKPDVLVFVDDSKSATLLKGDYSGSETITGVIEDLNLEGNDEVNFRIFGIGNEVIPSSLDSLAYNKNETNLFDVFQQIKDSEFDITSSILITDGIYTVGRDPIYSLSNISVPIYTIAIGDTSRINDVILKAVKTQPIGYVNTDQLIEATIQQQGFDEATIGIELVAGEQVIERRDVTFDENESSKVLRFELPLTEEGIKQFELRAEPLTQEWTSDNNSQLFTIEVLDNKVQILSLAFEIHPDVGAIRNILKSDANIELTQKTWIEGSKFIEGNSFPSADSLELIIVHGLPNSQSTLNQLNEYLSEVPSVLFQLPLGMDIQTNPLYSSIVQLSSYTAPNSVGFSPAADSDDHPILELPEIDYSNMETVTAQYRSVRIDPLSKPLFNISFQGIQTAQPIISISESTNLRRVHVNGYGWYKLNQSNRQQEREYFKALINNIVSWASNKPDNRKLKINPSQRVFNSSESVQIDAYLENESGNIEREGRIDIEITDPEGESRNYTMDNNSDGSYNLDLPLNNQGLYSFNAVARKGDRIIDEQKGEFVLAPSNSELINTVRNDELLKQSASLTGGKYFNFNDADQVIAEMNAANLFQSNRSQREVYSFVIHNPLWFVIVVLLLASEWLTRKYYSLP